jgi:hypothetical protein
MATTKQPAEPAQGRQPSSAVWPLLALPVALAVACAVMLGGGLDREQPAASGESCDEGFAGPDCRECEEGYGGSFCEPICDGNECEEGWAGPDCLACAEGHGGDFCSPAVAAEPMMTCDAGEEQVGSVCAPCPAGMFDHDRDPRSPCKSCLPGFSSPEGSVICLRPNETPCERGSQQLRPTYRSPDGIWQPAVCEDCAAGRWDHDRSAATPCQACRDGFFSPSGSIICVNVPALADR